MMMRTFRAFLMRAMWIKNWQYKSYLRQMPSLWHSLSCGLVTLCVSVCAAVYTAKSFAVIKITQLVVIYDVSVIKFYSVSLNHISGHKVDPFRAWNASVGLCRRSPVDVFIPPDCSNISETGLLLWACHLWLSMVTAEKERTLWQMAMSS